ncbi:hypothetical protein BGI09_00010, partial [Snodgrassella alvi]|uniref:hypothetical protein n=1 Tax=Snodgrassella alvi TaxID=1196083 RepID=UPI000A0B4418
IVNDRKYELENKLDNIDSLFSIEKFNLFAMIEDMDHDYFETEYILKKLKVLNEYFESIDVENEPEKIFEQFADSLNINLFSSHNDNFIFSINLYPLSKLSMLKNKKELNYFILSKVDDIYGNLKFRYSINLPRNDISKVTSKYDSCIERIIKSEDNTYVGMIIRLDRKILIELNCTKYAQYIK